MNTLVLWFYAVLRILHRIHHPSYDKNRAVNDAAVCAHEGRMEKDGGLIENQPDYTDMCYGRQKVSFCACEVIAVFNALTFLQGREGKRVSFCELLCCFERDGIVLSGFFGTAPQAIHDFLTGQGYEVRCVKKETEYDSCGAENTAFILTMYNNKKRIWDMIHTVCITKDNNGLYTMHNGGMEHRSYPSLTQLLRAYNNGKAGGIMLYGVRKKPSVIDN